MTRGHGATMKMLQSGANPAMLGWKLENGEWETRSQESVPRNEESLLSLLPVPLGTKERSPSRE